MHEYAFVSIRVTRSRSGSTLETDYQRVIREHAEAGWKLAQVIDFAKHPDPHFDLVFSRKVKQ
jgi:hypothetical protein